MKTYRISVIGTSNESDNAPERETLLEALDDAFKRVEEGREFDIIQVMEHDTDDETYERCVFSVYFRPWGAVCSSPLLDTIMDIEEAAAVMAQQTSGADGADAS
jgi:hypothetical protein